MRLTGAVTELRSTGASTQQLGAQELSVSNTLPRLDTPPFPMPSPLRLSRYAVHVMIAEVISSALNIAITHSTGGTS